jgi:hypothetical protein
MPDLRPCTACQRHVELRETACPFCSAALQPAEPRSPFAGKITRAAVFASATLAAVGAGACGGSKKPDTNTNTNTVVQPARDDAGVADAAEAPPVLEERHHSRNPNNTPMPYGAPPARRRVV